MPKLKSVQTYCCALILILAGWCALPSFALSTQVGGGTLSYTVTGSLNLRCGPGGMYTYNQWNFTNFTFLVGGVTYNLSGSGVWFQDNDSTYGCPPPGPQNASLLLPAAAGYPSNAGIVFTPAGPSANYTGTAVCLGCGYQDVLYPKYVVVGVTYAPPGINSSVQYANTTSVGTSSTMSSSFSHAIGYTVTVGTMADVPGVIHLNGSLKLQTSQSTTYTQTQGSSNKITLTKSTTTSDTTAGYPTTNAPNGPVLPAKPNDYDVIWLWLNPALIFTGYPNIQNVEWNGYAFDPNDINGMDIYPIQVGCLNGDFDSVTCSTQQGVLNRSWVIGQVSPTTGATPSPAILPNTQDAYNILAADPLAYNPGGASYTLFNTSPLPITTSDGRYTQFCVQSNGTNCPNPVFYEAGQTQYFNMTQMNTQQQDQSGSSEVKSSVSVSVQASSGFMEIFGKQTTYAMTDTITQTNSWLQSLTNSQTIQNAFTIKGSNPPNYVKGEFLVYQDNTYGTFMFYPWQ